jgi:hypothetical protein
MKQLNNDKSVFDKLDHKHRTKSEIVFLKLLAKQKKPANPFDKVRSQTWNPVDKSDLKNELEAM